MINKFIPFYRENIFLFPLAIMIFGSLGRGVENSLLFLFLVTNLIVLFFIFINKDLAEYFEHKKLVVMWALIYLSWMISIISNQSYDNGLKEWFVSFLTSSSIMLTLLLYKPISITNFLRSKSILYFVFFVFFVFIANLLLCMSNIECNVRSSVTTLPLSLYWVFLIIPFYALFKERWKLLFSFSSLVVFPFLLMSLARTEILMFLVMLLFLWSFYFKKLYLLFLAPILLGFVIVIYPVISSWNFYTYPSDLVHFIYQISSQRLYVWELALSNLPSNLLFGSGIGNAMAFMPENSLNDAFHNAFLEIFYETGGVGLILFLSFLFYCFRNFFIVLESDNSKERHLYMAFQSAMAALIVAGFFEKGYMSSYYKFDFYFFLIMIHIIGFQISKLHAQIDDFEQKSCF